MNGLIIVLTGRHCESFDRLRINSVKPFGPERLDLSSSTGLTAEGQS